jgi:hypothetical protein
MTAEAKADGVALGVEERGSSLLCQQDLANVDGTPPREKHLVADVNRLTSGLTSGPTS